MKESPLPRYVKCIKVWYGTRSKSIVGKVYDTDRPSDFSSLSWEELLFHASRNFIQCNENEQTVNEQFKFFL